MIKKRLTQATLEAHIGQQIIILVDILVDAVELVRKVRKQHVECVEVDVTRFRRSDGHIDQILICKSCHLNGHAMQLQM